MKAFFLSRLLREKLLLLGFVLMGAVVWASSASGRASALVGEYRRTTADLNVQQMWLDRREAIEEEAIIAIRHLDPARSFDGVRLSAELNGIAASAGLGTNTISSPLPTERTEEFVINSIQFRINRAGWDQLKHFYLELAKRAPYITIESFIINAERNNPAQLNAQLRVTAVEITSAAR